MKNHHESKTLVNQSVSSCMIAQNLPKINIESNHIYRPEYKEYYHKIIQGSLSKLFKGKSLENQNEEQKIDFLKSQFPNVSWEYNDQKPFFLSIRCIYNYRIYSSKFIYDIISRWLIPGKRINIISQFGSDFSFQAHPDERFILLELDLKIETTEDLKTIQKTLPMIATEIRIGVDSISQGVRILEIKGLNVDDKINLVQESIVSLMNQKTDHFDHRLFSEMQRFFVFTEEDFKEKREYRHLVRIICWQYLFRKSMDHTQEQESGRLIRVKLMKTRLHYPYGAKTVLGVLIGISQIKENEKFGEAQIIRAVKKSIPQGKLLAHSFIANRKSDESGAILYAEFEKPDNASFTYEELTKLRTDLPDDLRDNVEQFAHPIFMPRNEEEVMRNILNLSKQLKTHSDIPQVIISFDSQSEQHIMYSFVMLRAVKNDDPSVQHLCAQKEFKYELIPDRIKIVGHIKRRYVKEASVFYVRLDKQNFLRQDHSLDLYKARLALLNELVRVFKDVRDYNGGTIAKENELFNELKATLKMRVEPFSELVLENFFYSINPVIVRSLIDVQVLKTSFSILKTLIENPMTQLEDYVLKIVYQSKYIYVYIVASDLSFEKDVDKALDGLKLARFQLTQSLVKVEDSFYKGLIFHSERHEERKRFCDVLRKSLKLWKESRSELIA